MEFPLPCVDGDEGVLALYEDKKEKALAVMTLLTERNGGACSEHEARCLFWVVLSWRKDKDIEDALVKWRESVQKITSTSCLVGAAFASYGDRIFGGIDIVAN